MEQYIPYSLICDLFSRNLETFYVFIECWHFTNMKKYSSNLYAIFSSKPYWHVQITLRKLVFLFLSNWMGYDRGDSFPLDFEPNRNPFGSKLKGKLSLWSYPIQFERKRKTSYLVRLKWKVIFTFHSKPR